MDKMLKNRLINKSIEAFIMGLEIYNKPTIRYRIEGFSFFICNAWELMLKAELLNRKQEIYYRDNPERTISLEKCIQQIFTNKHDPLRKNIERIVHLRNISTHFITEDYEYIYAPLFQSCVENFSTKIKEFHDISINNYVEQNFLTLTIKAKELTEEELRMTYAPDMIERFLKEQNEVEDLIESNSVAFARPVATYFYLTKDKKDADIHAFVDKNAEATINVVKDIKDVNNIYPHKTNDVIRLVNRRLKSHSIEIHREVSGEITQGKFNTYDFQLFNKFYDIKIKDKKKYSLFIQNMNRYLYSQELVEFIFNELKKNPETLLPDLKKRIKK